MSGSSLDGLDIAYVQLVEIRNTWSYEIIHADCLPYTEQWCDDLLHATNLHVGEFLKLNTCYGKYIGGEVNKFIAKYNLSHKVHFLATHGHTVFHEPEHATTCQVGDGATIAAVTRLPVISDLRAMDVALGGQGAPIVPIGDQLLFSQYDYMLNIGGIANISVPHNGSLLAYDICPANQVLNILAQREHTSMDENGAMAAQGVLLPEVLDELNNGDYYKLQPPKSLSNEAARDLVFPSLLESSHTTHDLLHTATIHIAQQIVAAISRHPHSKEEAALLITGGGAFNAFLVMQLRQLLAPYRISVTVPDATVVKYKEALIMALIGTLRWREEVNVLSIVTGAIKDSIGGALWIG